jgi:prophage maintenance system killer protein
MEGSRKVFRDVDHYSLDVIISVGYRVKSQRGTQFRIWANRTLKEYLLQGYVINEKQLLESQNKFKELQETVQLIGESVKNPEIQGQERELLSVLKDYSSSLTLLGKYDDNKLRLNGRGEPTYVLTYSNAISVISEIKSNLIEKKETHPLFGTEIEDKFKAVVGCIYQTFDGKDLYSNIEEKASNLFYLIVKDHAFTDGNKRIASIMFVYFLNKNKYLYRKDGEKKINDNTLVALAILIATSNPKDKDVLIKLLVNILRG